MAKTSRPDTTRNYIRYIGAHPEVAHPDAGFFRRNEATGPFDEETIKLLTKDGESKEFERCAQAAQPEQNWPAVAGSEDPRS